MESLNKIHQDQQQQETNIEHQETNFSELPVPFPVKEVTENKDEAESGFEADWKRITEEEKRLNIGYYISFPFVTGWLILKNNSELISIISKILFFIGYWIFTGFAMSINYGEGVVLLTVGLVTLTFIAWDKLRHDVFYIHV